MTDDDILGLAAIRMDDVEGPVLDFRWEAPLSKEIVSRHLDSKALVSFMMLASADSCPRIMALAEASCVLSPHGNSLLVMFLSKSMPMESLEGQWKRLRIIHGKSNGEPSRITASLQKLTSS